MMTKNFFGYIVTGTVILASCSTIKTAELPTEVQLPQTFTATADTMSNHLALKDFFVDEQLRQLIDTALNNNYDLKAAVQRVAIASAHTRMANAARLPQVSAVAGASVDKYGKYTLNGVGNYDTNLSPNISKNQSIPDPTPDYFLGFRSTWEIDIWGKLKDRRAAAYSRYLASEKGKQWLTTQLVAEVARLYYELSALDYQKKIIQRNIELQKRGLEVVEAQMAGGRATALAVRQFKAQVLHTQGTAVEIEQQIIKTENELNSLLGRFPTPITRDSLLLTKSLPAKIQAGLPSAVLLRRPDIQEAELELIAAKADVSAVRKALLPSLELNPYIGLNAFKASLLFSGSSVAAGAVGSLAAPLFNRGAIISGIKVGNAQQATAFYNYQKNIINAYQEVVTQLQTLDHLQKLYNLKAEEVQTLSEGVVTANDLYLAGYASYLEVIMAQGSVLQAEMQQVQIKKEMFTTLINLYRSLGGN